MWVLSDVRDQDIGYDGVKRLVRMRAFLPDGATPFLDRQYGYNRANVCTFERRNDDFGLEDRFTYDSVYRIVDSDYDENGFPGAPVRDTTQASYTLDGVGNRRVVEEFSLTDGATAKVHSVNAMNEYTAIAGVARSHDDNGNLLADGERVMSFDYKNRLVAVTDAATGNPVAEYRYYADNRRAEKRVFSETAPGVLDEATAFFWDGWRCCEEQDAQTGQTETTYVWSPVYVDELVQFERTAAHDLGAGRFWVHQDARADVVAVTDAAGSVVERRFYDDFGRLLDAEKEPTTESATGLEYGFQGRRLDAETGLVYFRNRYYDTETGRFLQRDPVWDVSNVGGWYTFVGNGPWSGRDALGLTRGVGKIGARVAKRLFRRPKKLDPDTQVPEPNWGLAPRHGSAPHNHRIDRSGRRMREQDFDDIRKNQEQVTGAGSRVGENKPDLQGTNPRTGERVVIEWDTDPTSALHHAGEVVANDPAARATFIVIDRSGNPVGTIAYRPGADGTGQWAVSPQVQRLIAQQNQPRSASSLAGAGGLVLEALAPDTKTAAERGAGNWEFATIFAYDAASSTVDPGVLDLIRENLDYYTHAKDPEDPVERLKNRSLLDVGLSFMPGYQQVQALENSTNDLWYYQRHGLPWEGPSDRSGPCD